jgi:hypothetical protein
MATIVWPTVRAFYISGYECTGGKEIAVGLQSGGSYSVFPSVTARYKMTLHYNGLRTNRNAPAPYASSSEAKAVHDCILALKRGDVTTITDPVTGTSRTWRLDAETAQFQRIPKTTWWQAEIPLRSVE